MKHLIIAGSGAGTALNATQAVLNAVRSSDTVFQTARMPLYASESKLKPYKTADSCYENAQDFNALCDDIYSMLLSCEDNVCYVVYGAGNDRTAMSARQRAIDDGIPVTMLCGIPLETAACTAAGVAGLAVSTASDIETALIDPAVGIVVTEVDNPFLAGDVKCRLLDVFDGDSPTFFYFEHDDGTSEICPIPLYEADRRKEYGHTACVIVPPLRLTDMKRFTFSQLLEIMRILRAPDGCPWDREQTHQTLTRYLLEESYEVADAVRTDDTDALADELGDVLLQVVFHAQIATDSGEFSMNDIATAVCHKMIIRHPHIFADVHVNGSDDVLTNWDAIKRQEKAQKTNSEALHDIAGSMPALMRAEKAGSKVHSAGMDFSSPEQARQRLTESIARFESAGEDYTDDAVGCLLFDAVNYARLLKIQPEMALNRATDRFMLRFCRMDELIRADGKELKSLTEQEKNAYWKAAKQ